MLGWILWVKFRLCEANLSLRATLGILYMLQAKPKVMASSADTNNSYLDGLDYVHKTFP